MQIEDFIKHQRLDILHLQEVEVNDSTFESCPVISSCFTIIPNNSPTQYGTASLVKNEIVVENIQFDSAGRIIVFEACGITHANVYLPSGCSQLARSGREEYCAATLPQLLLHRSDLGYIGGDFNCIIDRRDCSANASSKMSPSLKRLVSAFYMGDAYRLLHPGGAANSHYYSLHPQSASSQCQDSGSGAPSARPPSPPPPSPSPSGSLPTAAPTPLPAKQGYTRIDRCYMWGGLSVSEAKYEPAAFSDHHAHLVSLSLPPNISRITSAKARPIFKIKPEVIRDDKFKAQLAAAMSRWNQAKEGGLELMVWWEVLVKPGIKKLAMERGKEMNKERRGMLNLLLLQQSYHARKVYSGQLHHLAALRTVQLKIKNWYEEESAKVILQAKSKECSLSEPARIYHHELNAKRLKKSSILKLETPSGVLLGHEACARFLEEEVAKVLLVPNPLNQAARDTLLKEIKPVFTMEDNRMLLASPSKSEVKQVLSKSNLHASPGTDGIPGLLYHLCWDVMGDSLTEVVKAIFSGNKPTKSQRCSLMVFGSKPKKGNSFKPEDKRRISLLNSDYKVVTGVEAKRFHSTATHSLSPLQLVAGSDRRIQHGICRARDAIQAVGRSKSGCGLLDTDFKAGFDWLEMGWVFAVLRSKGCDEEVIQRLERLYSDCTTMCVVNNVIGKPIYNLRLSLRQGDVPSMYWFSIGLDPLLFRLDRLLSGIKVFSLIPKVVPQTPILLPVKQGSHSPQTSGSSAPSLCPSSAEVHTRSETELYKVQAYADDVKCGIVAMHEFAIVIESCSLLEQAGGVQLHRDVSAGKVSFLPLGRWRGTLQQEDLPYNFIKLTDSIDFLGVTLKATFVQTRKANCDSMEEKIKKVVGPWKGGKFMWVTQRGHSANCYAFSKIFHRCASIPLREDTIACITSQVRSWVLQDFFQKPAATVLHRKPLEGGLGLYCVKLRALALLLRTFCELACTPGFRHSLQLEILFRTQVLGETWPVSPPLPPYYNEEFFSVLRHYHLNSSFNVCSMKVKDWYNVLLQDKVTHSPSTILSSGALLPVRAELAQPDVDWPTTWRRARLSGLPSDLTSHLFRQLHDVLPLQTRVARLGGSRGPRLQGVCRLCTADVQEDAMHAFFSCTNNKEAATTLLCHAQRLLESTISPEAALYLSFETDPASELAVTLLLAAGFKLLWDQRDSNKAISRIQMTAELSARTRILAGSSKFAGTVAKLQLALS